MVTDVARTRRSRPTSCGSVREGPDRQAKHLEQFAADLGYANNLVYYPPDQKHYYIARGSPTRVFALSPDRSD